MLNAHEVIAAFIDGERVDSVQLAEALAESEGREYLIDLLALRELVDDDVVLADGREIVRKESLFSWPRLSIAATLMKTFGSGVTTSHSYGLARSYVAVLTVTDDSGKKATTTGTVTVK